MTNHQIIFTAPGQAELLERPVVMPAPGMVLVKTAYSTISSGTERANLSGDNNISCARGTENVVQPFPRSVGYSSSGIVCAVGEGVTSVKEGDRVAVSWGKHSRYQTIDQSNVHPLPDGISMQDAAFSLIGTFPMAAIRKCRLEIGESAIVMGLGILGRLAVQLLRAAGACPVIAADPVEERRNIALSYGADLALDPFAPDFEKQVRRATGGKGVNVAIEVTGQGKALDQVLDCMAPFGRVGLLGCTRHSDFTIDYYRKVHGPGITLIGAHTNARPVHESFAGWWTTRDDIQALLRLVVGGRIRLVDMVQDIRKPEEAGEVFDRLMTDPNFPLTQFDWREEGDCL